MLLPFIIRSQAFCTCPLSVVQSVGKNLIFAYQVLCESDFARISPKQGNVEPTWLLPVSYTTFVVLLPFIIRLQAFCTCPLSVVHSVRKNLIFAYRVSLRNLLCLNVTNARDFVAKHPIVSKLYSTDHVAVFTSPVQCVLHMSLSLIHIWRCRRS